MHRVCLPAARRFPRALQSRSRLSNPNVASRYWGRAKVIMYIAG